MYKYSIIVTTMTTAADYSVGFWTLAWEAHLEGPSAHLPVSRSRGGWRCVVGFLGWAVYLCGPDPCLEHFVGAHGSCCGYATTPDESAWLLM
jgi:hypothetical protein